MVREGQPLTCDEEALDSMAGIPFSLLAEAWENLRTAIRVPEKVSVSPTRR